LIINIVLGIIIIIIIKSVDTDDKIIQGWGTSEYTQQLFSKYLLSQILTNLHVKSYKSCTLLPAVQKKEIYAETVLTVARELIPF